MNLYHLCLLFQFPGNTIQLMMELLHELQNEYPVCLFPFRMRWLLKLNSVCPKENLFEFACAEIINKAGTIIWNGPVGVFEFDQFGEGTRALSQAIAASAAFSIAGGGDTLAAVDKYGIADQVSYISTGGGAFLEFLEGKQLPAVAMLETRYKNHARGKT